MFNLSSYDACDSITKRSQSGPSLDISPYLKTHITISKLTD